MLTLLNLKFCHSSHITQAIFVRALSTSQLKEYYAILNVQKSSTPKEIKESFLRLSKIYHPDNRTTGSHLKFVQLKQAYDAIKDGPPAVSDTYREAKTNTYSNYDEHVDLSHKAHAFYRENNRDYPGSSFGGPYYRSSTPWEDYKRDRDYYKRKAAYEKFSKGRFGQPMISLTLLFSAIAWIVIYSSVLLVWDFNEPTYKRDNHRNRGYKDYLAYQEHLQRRAAEGIDRDRVVLVRDRMSTRIEPAKKKASPKRDEPIKDDLKIANENKSTEILEDDLNLQVST